MVTDNGDKTHLSEFESNKQGDCHLIVLMPLTITPDLSSTIMFAYKDLKNIIISQNLT